MVVKCKWYYKGNRELAAEAITMSRATGSIGSATIIQDEIGFSNNRVDVRREGFQDDTYTFYGEV